MYAAFSGTKWAAQAIFGATVFNNQQRAENYEEALRLGLNPILDREHAEKVTQATGLPPEVLGLGQAFRTVELKPEELPGQEFRAGKYQLTETELYSLLDGIRHEGLQGGQGPEAERLRALCEQHGASYDDFRFLFEGHGTDFVRLKQVNENRLTSPKFQLLMATA